MKLAYPSFEDEQRKTITKDYFVRSVHPDMQVALKSMSDFATASVDKLAIKTARLQIAGIKSFHLGESHECMSVNDLKIDEIAS